MIESLINPSEVIVVEFNCYKKRTSIRNTHVMFIFIFFNNVLHASASILMYLRCNHERGERIKEK